jgi:hypothetical protein
MSADLMSHQDLGGRMMRVTPLQWLLRRIRRKARPDLWQFGADVQDVMARRISSALRGDLTAAEARRMVMEKQSAAIRAQHAYARALLKGDVMAGNRDCFDIYQRAVQSNRKRLRARR